MARKLKTRSPGPGSVLMTRRRSVTAAAAETPASWRNVVTAFGDSPASEKARTRMVAFPNSSWAAR
jgi:hypothetical protein